MAKTRPTSYKDIPGWFDFPSVYDEALRTAQDGDILIEVGTAYGKSAAYMGQIIKESGKDVKFFAVDHFGGTASDPAGTYAANMFEQWVWNMHNCGVNEQVQLIQMNSIAAAKQFKAKTVHFVFIDAAHDYESVKADIAAWKGKVKSGGTLAGHDYGSHAGVRQAVDEAFGDRVIQSGNSWVVLM